MITFKPRKYNEVDLIPEAVKYLTDKGITHALIPMSEADEVSKINSRSLVLRRFFQTSEGNYQIEVQEKSGYRYTPKHLEKDCGMKIIKIDQAKRTVQAETQYMGQALDAIEVLALQYNLSVVNRND